MKKENKKLKVIKGRPLTFYKEEKMEVQKRIKTGILYVCCKDMAEALKEYCTKNGITVFPLFYNNYRQSKTGLTIPTHYFFDYDTEICDYKKMNYCPFCGTKINGCMELGD